MNEPNSLIGRLHILEHLPLVEWNQRPRIIRERLDRPIWNPSKGIGLHPQEVSHQNAWPRVKEVRPVLVNRELPEIDVALHCKSILERSDRALHVNNHIPQHGLGIWLSSRSIAAPVKLGQANTKNFRQEFAMFRAGVTLPFEPEG